MCESASEDELFDEDDADESSDFDHYYRMSDIENEIDYLQDFDKTNDPEYFEYECLPIEEVEKIWNTSVEEICKSLSVTPSRAKVLLFKYRWDSSKIIEIHRKGQLNAQNIDISNHSPPTSSLSLLANNNNYDFNWRDLTSKASFIQCNICLRSHLTESCIGLSCGHLFCKDCWSTHLDTQVSSGIATSIECMAQGCHELVPEDFALDLLRKPALREKYLQFALTEYVQSHPELRFCPGLNCNVIIRSKECRSKRVVCVRCKTSFCYKCGSDYHAPTDCNVIKKWLTKCADDSETANYISAHTKDCPNCHICIEKNGGCNHMQCLTCRHNFCWMCLGDWKTHGSEYYECSRYKEDPNASSESVNVLAREALRKYLFYYERWDNHARSLRLEEQALSKIKERIQREVMSNKGTWIDWQYLLDAAALLAKCRYTLQYTYPYAYYMESGPRKQLFEYQQAQLEAEIENLSWKLERAETTDRGDLENQMDIAEKRRASLLKDFLAT